MLEIVRVAVPVLVGVIFIPALGVLINWVGNVKLVGESETAGAFPDPACVRNDTELAPEFETATSSLPSRSKSPVTIATGVLLVGESACAWKVPSPFPSRIETLLPEELAVVRSSLPSPLKLPTAIEFGPAPVAGD